MLLKPISFLHVPGQVAPPGLAIIDSGIVWDNTDLNTGPSSGPWTVSADTTLLVVALMFKANPNNLNGVTYDSVPTTEILKQNGGLGLPGVYFGYIEGPSIGTNTMAFDGSFAGPTNAPYAVHAWNIKGEAAVPIGATDATNTSANGSSYESNILTTAAGSLVVCATCAQGYDTSPITATGDNIRTAWGDTGGGDVATDIGYAAGDIPAPLTIGSYTHGWNYSSADGRAIAAVEILAA